MDDIKQRAGSGGQVGLKRWIMLRDFLSVSGQEWRVTTNTWHYDKFNLLVALVLAKISLKEIEKRAMTLWLG